MHSGAYCDNRFECFRVPTAHGALYVERSGHNAPEGPHWPHRPHWPNGPHGPDGPHGRDGPDGPLAPDGRAVVLIHGFGTNASLWRGVSARLAHEGCLVLAPDLLGHGASARPRHATCDLAEHADALAAALFSVGITAATVVGQDVGGLVALLLAARHPELVSQLVIINPPDRHTLPPPPVRAMQRVAERFPEGLPDNQLAACALVAALLKDATADPAQLPSATAARYLAPWLAEGGAAQLCVMAQSLTQDSVPAATLAAVVAPTLVIRSEGDRSVSGAVSQALTNALPNAVLRSFPHYGRLLGNDAPDTLARTLLDWMQRAAETVATEQAVYA